MTVNSQIIVKHDLDVSLAELAEFSDKMEVVLGDLRTNMLDPQPRKLAPQYTTSELAELCGITRDKVNYLLKKEEYPPGIEHGRTRLFSLEEARIWIQKASSIPQSSLLADQPAKGRVIMSANLKGGSGKTTTAVCLGQGLSLLGRNVLIVDLDPQASATELCGIFAEKEVTQEGSALGYIYSENPEDLEKAICKTYWNGLDCIPTNPSLFDAEFHLPGKTISEGQRVALAKRKASIEGVPYDPSDEWYFWTLLRDGLEPLKAKYDYIIVDTAPSLSFVTINAFFAADALVVPLVPKPLDFISSVVFWKLMSDLASSFGMQEKETEKKFDFISILLSKVEQSSTTETVRNWCALTYKDWLHQIEIPKSSLLDNTSEEIATFFDVSPRDVSKKTLDRIRSPFFEYCHWIDNKYFPKEG